MGKFDHLKSREISDRTVWFHVPQVSERALLLLRPATDANHAYRNGMLRLSASRVRDIAASKKLTHHDVEQSRLDDRKLYPEFVVADWSGIYDVDGVEVPFSREAATEFFEQLPSWIFDRIRVFAMVPENFLPVDVRPIDKEGLLGNSESGSSGN